VFGHVTAGTDVVDRIKGVATMRYGTHQDVPDQEVVIEAAEVVSE
jgi:peptidyl-prolyl cis-trans isomerase B (cyclophilin B)